MDWPGKDGKHSQCPPQGNQPNTNTVVKHSIHTPALENVSTDKEDAE